MDAGHWTLLIIRRDCASDKTQQKTQVNMTERQCSLHVELPVDLQRDPVAGAEIKWYPWLK